MRLAGPDVSPLLNGCMRTAWNVHERLVFRMIQRSARPFQQVSGDCALRPEDIADLAPLQELLAALNDPYCSTPRVHQLVGRLPRLSARCIRAAKLTRDPDKVRTLDQALRFLGNRGLEGVLLQYLEDLTILSAEIDSR